MNQKVREELFLRMRQRYAARNDEGRTKRIDELCEEFGDSRKHAIELMGAKAGWGGDPSKRKGRPHAYPGEVAGVMWKTNRHD